MIVFHLPFPSPPLRSNKRLHHMAEHRIKKDIRHAGLIAGSQYVQAGLVIYPLPVPVHVRMVWSVPTKHRRDADSGQPTVKAYLDGLVEAGLLVDDNWQHVPRVWCEIEYAPGEPMSVRVEIQAAK